MMGIEIRKLAAEPVDASSVRVYRVVFGGLMVLAVARFFVHGWIDSYFYEPTHFFHYYGFSWVKAWAYPGMYVHFALMGTSAIAFMLGYRPRLAISGFGVLFAYQHLIDKTNYLNHYYLVVCLCVLMAALPLWRGATIPRWALWALRGQVAVVYLFGGIAKLNPDWLVHAQPMRIWLAANTDFPVIGWLFEHAWVAHGFSISGAVFDLGVVPALLHRRTRPYAYVAVVGFHLVTMKLFMLGMFPWIMMASSLLFLPPDWPRQWLGRSTLAHKRDAHVTAPRWLAVWFALQLLIPLRHVLYPGAVTWTEEGYRFSWNVMRMEKTGSVDAIVTEPSTGRRWVVNPTDYYTRYQTKMMSTQPDMILELAHVVAADFRARGIRDPEVRIDAMAALNGRRRARLIDPTVDLARESDGLLPRPWILR